MTGRVQEGPTIPAVLELGLLRAYWRGSNSATSCSFRQLRALLTRKMGQRAGADKASGTGLGRFWETMGIADG